MADQIQEIMLPEGDIMKSAIDKYDIAEVKRIIKEYGLDYEESWRAGYKLVQYCTLQENMICANLIIKYVNSERMQRFHVYLLHDMIRSGGSQRRINELLKLSAKQIDLLSEGVSLLYRAIQSGKEALVADLISLGANVNLPTSDDYTPLQIAIDQNRENVVEMLLEAGAIDRETEQGKSFHLAICRGNETIINLLLAHGIDAHEKDRNGNTALHGLCRKTFWHDKDKRALEFLLDGCDADPNAMNSKGRTPMFYAARSRSEYCVQILLGHDVDLNLEVNKSALIEFVKCSSTKNPAILEALQKVEFDLSV